MILVGLAALCMGQRKARVSPLKIIQLSPPNQTGSLSLEQVLIKQQTVSRFTEQPLSFTQIGQLAWAAQLITEPQKTSQTETAPSTPATAYHINLYVAAQDGLFLYHPDEHTLEGIIREDLREKLSEAAPNKEAVAGAPCSIIVAGSPKKMRPGMAAKPKKLCCLMPDASSRTSTCRPLVWNWPPWQLLILIQTSSVRFAGFHRTWSRFI